MGLNPTLKAKTDKLNKGATTATNGVKKVTTPAKTPAKTIQNSAANAQGAALLKSIGKDTKGLNIGTGTQTAYTPVRNASNTSASLPVAPKSPTGGSAGATTLAVGGARASEYTPTPAKTTSGGGTPRPTNISGNGGTPAPQPGAPQPGVVESTAPEWLNTGGPTAGNGGGGGGADFNSVRQDYANASTEDRATMAAMMEGMLSYIDQMGGQLTSQIKSQMGMDDPETANAIAMIRREAETMHKEMLEDLNAKGLVQSGIYAEAKSRLAESQGMNVSNFVAQRFGDLQSQLNSAMMNIGQMRTQAMSSGMGMVNQNLMADRTQQASMGMQNLSNQLTQRGQDLQNNQWGQSFDWQKQTDQRNFGYTQQRDAVSDQQFGQSLSASQASSGAGNSLGWANFNAEQQASQQYNQQTAYDNANNFLATNSNPATPEEYQRAIQAVNANPMFQDPNTKNYILSQIVKPQQTQQGGSFGDFFRNIGNGSYTPQSNNMPRGRF